MPLDTFFSPRLPPSNLQASLLQHGLRKTVITAASTPKSNNSTTSSPVLPNTDCTKPFKIRILTWNMHDSLPKGNLDELFGDVPPYDLSATKPSAFPFFTTNSTSHPYHLVVVAGQKCPTPSGIPMGLSASFKKSDKEREKTKIYDNDFETSFTKQKNEGSDDGITMNERPSGWTSMVEDYLCQWNGSQCHPFSSSGTQSPGLLNRDGLFSKATRKGSYTLLVKERLMGIYMAIYIHRDLKPFVQGTSKSAVTAGLIGGRLGNKGGVGISLRIADTTFLFLNAHLAAHEGKTNHRLANLTKIKSELSVDDFLSPEDARSAARDLTDRFDFTFLCGDLNFRLDISRLHADWLLAHQDFRQAFEFDQLNVLMKQGAFFKGFCEAPVNFPPTFKYDVLRTLKRPKKTRPSIIVSGNRPVQPSTTSELETVEETDSSEGTEENSLESSTKMATMSGPPTNPGNNDENVLSTSTSPPLFIDNDVASPASPRAKLKWLSGLSPSFISRPNFLMTRKENVGQLGSSIPSPANLPGSKPGTARKRTIFRPPPMHVDFGEYLEGTSSGNIDQERGVYDSSSKKRVPSWCDRVLWKSTIQPGLPLNIVNFATDIPHHARRISHQRFLHKRVSSSFATNGGWSYSSQFYAYSNTPNHVVPTPTFSVVPTSLHIHRHNKSSRTRRANTSASPPTTAPATEKRFSIPDGEKN